MLLLSSPRYGHRRRASLLLLLPLLSAVLLSVVPVSASPPAHSRCPLLSVCAKQRRSHCQPGSSHCGPCLSPLQENEEGRCVLMKHQQYDKITSFTDLDEDIDFLHSVIEKQEVSKMQQTKKQPKLPATLTLQTNSKNSKTDAPKRKQKNQDRLSDETMNIHTAASPSKTPTPQPRTTAVEDRAGPVPVLPPINDTIIVIIISVCVVVGTASVILAIVCFIRFQKESHLAEKVDYPAFGGGSVPANGTSMGDKTLAQSAQMFHYQHQKQQMLSMGNHKPDQKVCDTEGTSDEEEVGGGFTVYECPGLAPTGEMEVKNPLFDDSTVPYQGNPK